MIRMLNTEVFYNYYIGYIKWRKMVKLWWRTYWNTYRYIQYDLRRNDCRGHKRTKKFLMIIKLIVKFQIFGFFG